jgi:signal transduction histidine kinase
MTAWPEPCIRRKSRPVQRTHLAMPARKRPRFAWTPWAYALVCAPLALLIVELFRSAVWESQEIHAQTVTPELRELRSQTLLRAHGLGLLIEDHLAMETPWTELRREPWVTHYWSTSKAAEPHDLYGAVVDQAGNIVMHTDPARIGDRLERGWYDRKALDGTKDVVWTRASALGGNRPAYDAAAPVKSGEQVLGEYHLGLDALWLDAEVAHRQRAAWTRWAVVLAVGSAVDAAAIGALLFLGRQQSRVWRTLRSEARDRVRERAQLGAGLAHEIRNPLHALRINLHTLRRAFGGRSALPQEQLVATIQESDSSIDRLDGLMHDLLQFSDPSAGQVAEVDVVHEVRATLDLLAEDLVRERIEVRSQLPQDPAPIAIDPARLRQSLMNVLTFAQHRAGKSGKIDVQVQRRDAGVEIAVGDSGPQMPEDQVKRLFEPFQAPAETGSGLGLALVQVLVKEAGGRASWDAMADSGSRCRLWFPLVSSASNGGLL